MAFDNVVFPLSVQSFVSAPEYNTTIIPTGSGAEQRIANWADGRVTFNAAMGVRSRNDLQALIAFFRARKGRARGFLVKDLLDYQANGDVIAVGDGTGKTTFQLVRVYTDIVNSAVYGTTGNADIRSIYKPISGTVTVYSGSGGLTPLIENTHYTINYSTGVITLTSGLPNGYILNWFGEFYIPCRFVDDKLPADEVYLDMVENKAAGNIPDVGMMEIRDFT